MTRRQQITLLALLLVCYAYVLPRWADWNQNSRLNLIRALSEQRTVAIDAYVANTGDYALYNGRAYSDKAPGPALLVLPLALAAQPILASPPVTERIDRLAQSGSLGATLNPEGSGLQRDKLTAFVLLVIASLAGAALPTALGALALHGLLIRGGVAPAPAALTTVAYALATTVATYAGNFYSHALVAALLIGAYAVAWSEYAPARGVLAGLLLGWAVISEYPAALPAAVIAGAAVLRWRRPAAIGWLALGGAPALLLLALYDMVAFGTPLPVGYAHSALWQSQHQTGFVSLTYPHLDALLGLTFGAFRGLFVRAPWLLLAIPGYVLWWRSGRDRAGWWVALLAPLLTLLVYGSSAMWWGGFAAGPRYIVAAIPFLALAAGAATDRLWRLRGGRLAVGLAVTISAGLTWAEGVARQSFPPDSILDPWVGYTLPAWREGDLARSLGAALGLDGALALAPLAALIVAGAAAWLWQAAGRGERRAPPAGDTTEGSIVPAQL